MLTRSRRTARTRELRRKQGSPESSACSTSPALETTCLRKTVGWQRKGDKQNRGVARLDEHLTITCCQNKRREVMVGTKSSIHVRGITSDAEYEIWTNCQHCYLLACCVLAG